MLIKIERVEVAILQLYLLTMTTIYIAMFISLLVEFCL